MKFLFQKIALAILLLTFFQSTFAQSKYPLYIIDGDTIQYEKDSVLWKKKNNEQIKLIETYTQTFGQVFSGERMSVDQANDSILQNRHNYYSNTILGNMGLPSYSLTKANSPNDIGFNYYRMPYSGDMFDENQPVFYNSPLPLTSVFAVAGQKQEQMLKFLHTQNVKGKVNITLKLNRYKCDGFFQKQLGFVNNVLFSSNFKTKKENWGYYFYVLHNKLKHEENGGITNDSTIKTDPFGGKDLIPVNLIAAKRNNKTFDASLTQWLRIAYNSQSSHKIFYTAKYKGDYYQLTDEGIDSLYYKSETFTSGKLNDSIVFRQCINDARYVYHFLKESKIIDASIGYVNEMNWLRQPIQDTFLLNDKVELSLKGAIRNQSIALNSTYDFNGYNKGNYSIGFSYLFNNANHLIQLGLRSSKISPTYMHRELKTNSNDWSLDIKAQSTSSLNLNYRLKKAKLRVNACFTSFKNYIYIDSVAKNFDQSISYYNVDVSKDFTFKKITFIIKALYQNSSNQTVLSLPQFVGSAQLYYENDLFKKNLKLQVGAQAYYLSKYYGRDYNVALNQFTVQNQSKQGGYTFIDFFINFRIKPVCFFVKVEHLNQGLMGSNYNLVPSYFQNARSIKFGLNWVFWD